MPTIADILRTYGDAYVATYGKSMPTSHDKLIKDITRCRTEALGGHVYECPEHHQVAYKYHSCMNRHCPQCQNDRATTWLENERKRLINVPYVLVTFTLPQELRSLARAKQQLFYRLLFSESWRAMKKLAQNPRWLGGRIGALGLLHTWTRTLRYHPHVHYLVPAGGLSDDNTIWIQAQKKFFLPVKALSRIFRAMMHTALQKADPELFRQIPKTVWHKDWVVNCQLAGNGETVLKYFAPYVFRVAISNRRIVKLQNDQVTFVYKHSDTNQWTPMTLHVFEFIRRFLQHVLPQNFKKVRHFGFLSSNNKHILAQLQNLLGTVEIQPEEDSDEKAYVPHCPVCGKPMILIEIVPPGGFALRNNVAALSGQPVKPP